MFQKDPAVFCKRNGAAFSLKKNNTQFLFQIGNRAAQGRLGNIQFRCCETKVLALCNGLKIKNLI